MIKFLKRKKAEQPAADTAVVQTEGVSQGDDETLGADAAQQSESIIEAAASETVVPPVVEQKPIAQKAQKRGWFKRLTGGLTKTRQQLSEGIASAVLGQKTIDDELLEEIESQLIMADVGVEASQYFISQLSKRVSRKELADEQALLTALKEEMTQLLKQVEQPLVATNADGPFTILMVGINGAGKTTTIGKLTKRLQQQGKRVLLAAGDTFRAAAIEQLQVWGERNNIPVIAQQNGADSASVIFDAMQAAKARNVEVVIADTAGRLHNQSHLMEELKKIKRVMAKHDAAAPHKTLLVLDAGNGQNALMQAQRFNADINIDGICLTKLDGTAKGGIIFSIAKQLQLPIYFIGIGEQIDDLRPFDAEQFVEALFS
ncbi:MAG: signal recognition particle-docking protein FtsY [Gammaproteobacteria bacterium]|nr:signal recognition particle-docking protein FtsY [Gammaproteobacteria bacterium]